MKTGSAHVSTCTSVSPQSVQVTAARRNRFSSTEKADLHSVRLAIEATLTLMMCQPAPMDALRACNMNGQRLNGSRTGAVLGKGGLTRCFSAPQSLR